MLRHELKKKSDVIVTEDHPGGEWFDSWDISFDRPSEDGVCLDATVLLNAKMMTIRPVFEDGKFVRNQIVVLYPHGLYYPDGAEGVS